MRHLSRAGRRREVIYGFTELDELVLAYATTIHKSQGARDRSQGRPSAAAVVQAPGMANVLSQRTGS
jgi:hypothetical protein